MHVLIIPFHDRKQKTSNQQSTETKTHKQSKHQKPQTPLVCEKLLLFCSWSPTIRPIRRHTLPGGCSHKRRSAKKRVPEFSLQIKRIFNLSVSSISTSARNSTAIDFDFPAPKRPWMHRSRRFVNSAMVTAHSVPNT